MYRPTNRKHVSHEKWNDNGTRLINFAMTRIMIVNNIFFIKTYTNKFGQTRNKIDHILVGGKKIKR